MNVWPLELPLPPHGTIDREALLWDLAGQEDYRLIHRLFLEDSLIVTTLQRRHDGNAAPSPARRSALRKLRDIEPHSRGQPLQRRRTRVAVPALQPRECGLRHSGGIGNGLLREPQVFTPGTDQRYIAQHVGLDHGLGDTIGGANRRQQRLNPLPIRNGHQHVGRPPLVEDGLVLSRCVHRVS
jgi:hypothetical protein